MYAKLVVPEQSYTGQVGYATVVWQRPEVSNQIVPLSGWDPAAGVEGGVVDFDALWWVLEVLVVAWGEQVPLV